MKKRLEDSIHEEFEHAIARYHLGLNLCLAEQVILRKIISSVTEELNEIKNPKNKYRPAYEGMVRFLIQEYGLTQSDQKYFEPICGGFYDETVSFELNMLQAGRNML